MNSDDIALENRITLDLARNTRLSEHFSLYELINSKTALENGYSEQFAPGTAVRDSLTALCANILEPLRASLGVPVRVTSGYRCGRLNTAVNGSANSHHLRGMAADIKTKSTTDLKLAFVLLREMKFTQLIWYYDSGLVFLHVSYDPADLRCEVLECYMDADGTKHYEEIV